jgi:hypothetical protein
MALLIYLDESGDLGWNFTAPFRCGGSSRYLTIAALCVPAEKKHLPKRVIKRLYTTFGWPSHIEKKWSMMNRNERAAFASTCHTFCSAHADIHLHAITVKKENVQPHIRTDANKLYNYMIRLSLLSRMRRHPEVLMIPDPRSIKVESGNSLPDYIQTLLWFHVHCIAPHNISANWIPKLLSLSVGCMRTTVVEDGNYNYLSVIAPCLAHSRLYF